MHITADITLKYRDKKTANNVHKSLSIDDDIYVSSTVKNHILHAHINSKNFSSFLHTIDDYLSCLAVAEHIIEKKEKREITE